MSKLKKGIFVAGTGTDIGKTYVTALVVKKLAQHGLNAGYYKAALSGAEERNGKFIPGDAEYVRTVSGINQDLSQMVSYVYKNAVSPHLAAKIEGNPVRLEKVVSDYKAVQNDYDYVTVEGSGGIVCPIRIDGDERIMLEDIVRALNLPVLIIADGGLGTINSVVLTCEYIKHRGIPVKGIILNNFDSKSVMHRDNKEMIEQLTGICVVGEVECGGDDINIGADELAALYD